MNINQHNIYIENTENTDNNILIGYMTSVTGLNNSVSALVFVEIEKNTCFNLDREGIIDPLCATYTTNKFKIIKIVDEELNEYCVCIMGRKEVKKNEVIVDYSCNYTFYLSKKRAINSMKDYMFVGLYIEYFENGQKMYEYTLSKKHKKCGKYTEWNDDATLRYECNFLDGKLDGEYKDYNKGILTKHFKYSAGSVIEYLNCDFAINEIDGIFNRTMENFKLNITYIDLECNEASQSNKTHNKFLSIVEFFSSGLFELARIKSTNDKIIFYNDLKQIDIIKKYYDMFNTTCGKECLSVYPLIKENKLMQINELIYQFDKKIEPECLEIKLYLREMRDTLFL
jgi:antitoxin component YwqK of YwqJK toxin-antitoxin module